MDDPRPTSDSRIGQSHFVVSWHRCLAKNSYADSELRPWLIGTRTRLRRFDRRASSFHRQSLPTSDVSSAVSTVLEAYADLLEPWSTFRQWHQSHVDGPKAVWCMWDRAHERTSKPEAVTAGGAGRTPPSGLEALQPGDLIAFGSGFDAGSPRVASELWQKHQVAEVTVGRITSPIERTDQLVMPDELTGQAAYPWKIRFEHLGH